MKTMKNVFGMKNLSTVLIAAVLFLGSCSKSEETSFTAQDNQVVNNDGATEAMHEETSDLATSALNSADGLDSRVEEDVRLACATRSVETNPYDKTSGTVTINFDRSPSGAENPNGCTDPAGNVRKGSITVTWTGGRWYAAGSSHTIAFNNYSINGVKITGTRTVTNVSTPNLPLTWNITGQLTSTWPDLTTATRTVNRTRQWVRSATIANDKVIISQTAGTASAASGTNRYGKTYTVKITTPLEYGTLCLLTKKVYLPSKGVKEVTVDSKVYTVDFGTGTCDNTFTVTFNGKSKEFTAKNDNSND
jgi:hypothetical protein